MKKASLLYLLFALCLTSCENEGYNKDNTGKWSWKFYHGGSMKYEYLEIDSADHKTFQTINSDYAKDRNHVFFQTMAIEGADLGTFEVIDGVYSRDKHSVYFEGQKLVLANPKSFEVLDAPYSKDKEHVYCGTVPLVLAQPEVKEFKVTSGSTMSIGESYELFTASNPEYNWLDSNYRISYGEGVGRTNKRKFRGFREVK